MNLIISTLNIYLDLRLERRLLRLIGLAVKNREKEQNDRSQNEQSERRELTNSSAKFVARQNYGIIHYN